EAPIHETGQQLLQTGHIHRDGNEWPHFAAVVNELQPHDSDVPPWVLLPSAISNTGVCISHGQGSGFLGNESGPFLLNDATGLSSNSGVEVAALSPDPGRLTDSAALIDVVDAVEARVDATRFHSNREDYRAFDSLFNARAKAALNISDETDTVRARYGWNTF